MFKITANPRSHQKPMYDAAMKHLKEDGYILWKAGCGVGKTITSLAVASGLRVKRTLVLTTKNAMLDAWPSNFANLTEGGRMYVAADITQTKARSVHRLSGQGDPRISILTGDTQTRARQIADAIMVQGDEPVIVVINYESARTIWKDIKGCGFDLAIADESHKLKSYNSDTSCNLAEACIDTDYKIAMTGTPWEDKPTDIYGQVRWLYPRQVTRGYISSSILGRWHKDFYPRYVDYIDKKYYKIDKGYKNLEELQDIVAGLSYTISSDEALDLPDYEVIDRYTYPTDEIAQAHAELKKDSITYVEGKPVVADNALVVSMRLHQVSSGYVKTKDGVEKAIPGGNPKLDMLKDIVDETGGEPCVIFTHFQHDAKLIAEELDGVMQLTSDKQQHQEWQNGEGTHLVVNISAGSEGIELTRARYVIYYSVNFARINYEQSKWRVYRPGQKRNVTFFRIIMGNTIDKRIYRVLESKGNIRQQMEKALKEAVDNE